MINYIVEPLVQLEGAYKSMCKDFRDKYPTEPEYKCHGQWFYLNYCEVL